ncbi:Ribonuclease H domain [Sesbania bispinosa]|nr:Ribonuclease H domain [Sesbania bispinosa]
MAELHAILLGVKLAIKRKIFKVIFESDSSIAIRFIQFGCSKYHLCYHLVDNIRKLADSIPEFVWNHTRREGNFLAGSFANHAISSQESYVGFSVIPSLAYSVHLVDAAGAMYRRGSKHISTL